ncbi:MAG: zinc-ribbon domain-containing protein [Deltaproteobacteria bacterium]|nr:zinc-ribbon domain-containing protein [Deltaproteobacteria bacterium]
MRLSCPSCKTTFEIPEGTATAGKKVRCARCKIVFKIPGAPGASPPPMPAAAPAPAPQAAPLPGLAVTGSQRTAYEELQAAPPDPLPPGIGTQEDLDTLPQLGEPADPWGGSEGRLEVDPFADLEATPALSEPTPTPMPTPMPGGPSRGTSAIRAQSGAPATVEGAASEELTGAWKLRLSDGTVRNFDSMEEVHNYLGAHPDPGAEVSSDGRTWQDPDSLRSMQAPRAVSREPTGLSVALRAAAAPIADPSEGAGVGWSAAAVLATLLMLVSVLVAVQTLQVVDLSGWVPFDALGLDAIGGGRVAPVEDAGDPAVDQRAAYEALMGQATRARKEGQLVDAVIAYRRAVDTLESPEALEALAEVYETLGEEKRAGKIRGRLKALREKRGKRTP